VLFHFQYDCETSLLQTFIYIDFVRREPPCNYLDDKGIFVDVAYIYGGLA
jgi:hypothetical protein